MSEPDMKQAVHEVERFAAAWAAEITEAFKPFTAAAMKLQQDFRKPRP